MVLPVVLIATLSATTDAVAQEAAVRLEAPRNATPPSVRATVQLRDCGTRPTVTVVASWRRGRGRAMLEVAGIDRVLKTSPRRASRRTDQLAFRRVRRRGGRVRVKVTLITNWRTAKRGSEKCTVRLPRLVGTGDAASAAARGLVRFRTPLHMTSSSDVPQRGTARDFIWTCGGARRGDFDCGVTVAVAAAGKGSSSKAPETKEPKDTETPEAGGGDDDDAPDWATALLVALGTLAAGSVAVAATRSSEEGGGVPDTWDALARKEYAKADEPISARASDLTKVGAPIAAFITAVAASVGGWVADAPAGHTVIAVAIVIAVAVGGLFYVFAADFRSRAAVAVARFDNLCRHSQAEAKATDKVKQEAERAAREAAETAGALAKQLADTRKELARCKEAAQTPPPEPPAPEPPAPPATFLPMEGVPARSGGAPATIYGVESSGGKVVSYLVRGADGRLRWVPETEVSEVEAGD
jgi:hypothetical protein